MKEYWELKPGQENFQVMDGPFSGRAYLRGIKYTRAHLPDSELNRFRRVQPKTPKPKPQKTVEPEKAVEKENSK
jgi:hypothetical protein